MEQRPRAADLFGRGMTRAEVARRLGVSRATTSRWYRAWRDGDLAPKRRGRPPKIDAAAMARIERAIARGPRAWGFPLEQWTLAAVAALIARLTGTAYHRRHVGRVVRRIGWIVPPFGPHAAFARRRRLFRDPDGNNVALLG